MERFKITAVICTFNPRTTYLNRVLNALKMQTLSPHSWELTIIDNNSTQPVESLADVTWHPHSRIIIEPNQGLTNARLCGIRNTESDLLIFIDDDNVLNPDYLENAVRIGLDYPFLGAWGGKSTGEFEIPKPSWMTRKHLEMIAVRDIKKSVWSNIEFNWETTPIGAGLVIRRDVAVAYEKVNSGNRILLDRVGSSLVSGGDNDIVMTALELGYGTGRFLDLELTHLIPKERLSEEYIIRLTEEISFSNVLLFHLYGREYNLPPQSKGRVTNILNKINFYRLPAFRRALIQAEIEGVRRGKTFIKSLYIG